jgi:hypothetical protein
MFIQGQKLGIRAAAQGQRVAALIANCHPLPPTNHQQLILKANRPEINFSLACGNRVELRGFEPLAPSMRTKLSPVQGIRSVSGSALSRSHLLTQSLSGVALR